MMEINTMSNHLHCYKTNCRHDEEMNWILSVYLILCQQLYCFHLWSDFLFEGKHSQNQELATHVKKGNRILYLFKEEGIK